MHGGLIEESEEEGGVKEGHVDNNILQTETEEEPFMQLLHLTSIHFMIMQCITFQNQKQICEVE